MKNTPNPENKFRHEMFRSVNDASEVGMYLNGVLACINSAFEGGVTREDSLHHISGDLVTVLLDNEEVVRGFSSTVFASPKAIFNLGSSEEGCYLQGATVSKEIWGNGAYKEMNNVRIGEAVKKKLSLIFTRSQNPRVESGIISVLERYKQEGRIKGYKLERNLIKDCYGTMLTKDKPKLDNSDTGKAFKKLDFEAGDAYILTFVIKY